MIGNQRQLSAIMFSDVSGFSAIMHRDEQEALHLMDINRRLHQKVISEFQGRIIKELGDGMLCTFDSVTDAIEAGISIQKAASEIQGLNIGIGIHTGEIFLTSDDVFGDAINVASRIQSLGSSNSILFSEQIFSELKNKTRYKCAFIGEFYFKNIEKPNRIYALEGFGLVVPNKKELSGKLKRHGKNSRYVILLSTIVFASLIFWFYQTYNLRQNNEPQNIYDKIFFVGEFENHTGDSSLYPLGLMMRDWISQGLLESGKLNIMKEDIFSTSSPKSLKQIPKNAQILVRGKYFKTGPTQLQLNLEMLDHESGVVLFVTKSLESKLDENHVILEEAKQKLLGYIFAHDYKSTLSKSPPKYNAYEAFSKGIQTNSDQVFVKENFFLEAIRLDSGFVSPYFSIIELASNWGHKTLLDSIIGLINKRSDILSEYQFRHFEAFKARLRGELQKAADMHWALYLHYHQDQSAIKSINLYTGSNQCKKALEKFHQFKPLSRNPTSGLLKDQTYLGDVLESYNNLGYFDSVHYYVTSFTFAIKHYTIALAHLEALTQLRQWSLLEQQLKHYTNTLPLDQQFYAKATLWWKVVNVLYMMGEKQKLEDYLPFFHETNESQASHMFYLFFKGYIHYLKSEFDKAAEAHINHFNNTPQFRFFIAFPAVCYLKNNQAQKALEWMNFLKRSSTGYSGQWEYAQAIYKANVGNHSESMIWITKAFAKGYDFDFYSYQHDILLKDMHSSEEFIQFVAAK